ncbi:MAG: AsmA family protein [Alphaproteobacteria bacterium]|nr:AsmA family protein [Alphaproteobacteria bacterium]
MGKFTKRLILGFLGALVVLVGFLLIAPQFVPVEVYKKQIIEQAEAATGRTVKVNGEVSLRFIPRIQLTLGDVHISNPKDFGANAEKDMASLKELQLSLGLFDLLSGVISVKRFELIDPVIALEKNAKGKANWEFPSEAEQKASSKTPEKPEGQSFISQFQLPALSITNGTFSYAVPGEETVNLSKLNLRAEIPGLTSPANIALETTYGKDVPLKAAVNLDSPKAWLDGTPAKVVLEASAGNANVSFNGTAQQGKDGKILASGAVKGESASLKALGKQLGTVILPESIHGEGKFSFAANVEYADPQASAKGIAITLDGLQLNGDVSANIGGAKPSVTANLTSPGVLVVNDLLAPAKPQAAEAQAAPASGAVNEHGWSTEPVLADASFLNSANADVTLKLGGVKYDGITAGALTLAATLKNGGLALNLPDFDFYEGKANFALTLSAHGRTVSISQNAALTDINVGKFLVEANGFDKLEGKGNITLSTTTRGVSVADFVGALGGNGSLKMRDGAIKGINLAETVRNAKNLLGKGGEANSGVKTDFSELSATFTIAQGIVSNNDLSMKAPLLTLTGDGTVNLPTKRVDYRLRPTLVGTIEGQDRTAEATRGLTIPLKVSGTFDKLSFTPDVQNVLENVLQDPSKAKETLKEDLKGLKSLIKGF